MPTLYPALQKAAEHMLTDNGGATHWAPHMVDYALAQLGYENCMAAEACLKDPAWGNGTERALYVLCTGEDVSDRAPLDRYRGTAMMDWLDGVVYQCDMGTAMVLEAMFDWPLWATGVSLQGACCHDNPV